MTIRPAFAAVLLVAITPPAAAQSPDLAALQARLAALEKEAAAISAQLRAFQAAAPAPDAAATAADDPPQVIAGPGRTLADLNREEAEAELIGEQGGAQSRIGTALPDSPLSNSRGDAVRFLLSAGSDDTTVTLQLSRTRARSSEAEVLLPGYTGNRLIEDTFTVNASANLASNNLDGKRKSGFSRLDSLADGQKFTLRWSQMRSRIPDVGSGRFAEISAMALDRCRNDKTNLKMAADAVAAAARDPSASGGVTIESFLIQTCDTIADSKYYGKYLDPGVNRERQQLFDRMLLRRSFSYGVEASLGHNEFSYFDAGTPTATNPLGLAETDVSRVGWEVGGYASVFPLPKTAISLRGRYQGSFKATDTVTVCPPIPTGANSVQCETGSFAAPKRTEKLLLSTELRLWGGNGKGFIGRWAVAPSITLDALADDYEVDVPVFLVGNADGKLTGGVRLGYSNIDEAVFGIFIGSAFDPFK